MKFVTGYFCSTHSCNFLVLQQVTRKKGKLSIVFAFVGENECDIDAQELVEWFHERVLSCCERKRAAACVDVVQDMFCKKIQNSKGEWAALFAMDRECFYAWKGSAEIWLLNRLFNRTHRKKLTRLVDKFCVERVQIQPEITLFVGSAEYFANVSEQYFHEYPETDFFVNDGQADRYLRELAEISTDGSKHNRVAVMIVAQNKRLKGRKRDALQN